MKKRHKQRQPEQHEQRQPLQQPDEQVKQLEQFSNISGIIRDNIQCPTTPITRFSELKNRYCERYGFSELDNTSIFAIERAELELAECGGCTGEKCLKSSRKFQVPKIFDSGDGAAVGHVWCKWRPRRSSFKRALIPLRYASKTFDDYEVDADNEKAVSGAQWLIAQSSPSKGLYLYGECGTGKTFLAALVAREFVQRDQSVIFGDVPSLLEDLKATFDKGGTEALLDRYCDCDLLILDDIGAGKITDWSVGVLYQIINARYNADKPIIATSNYDLEGLMNALIIRDQKGNIVDALTGKRIVSRLREISFPIFLGDNDRREN